MNKNAAVEANTVYVDNELVARDVSVTLPEVTNVMTTIQSMGETSIPAIGLIEDMEAAITKDGIDKNKLPKMITPKVKNIEVRWVQDMVSDNGAISQVGCKAFLRCYPKTIMPGIGLEIGSNSESELSYAVNRYRLVVDGKEVLVVDKLARILKVNGKGYAKSINKLL